MLHSARRMSTTLLMGFLAVGALGAQASDTSRLNLHLGLWEATMSLDVASVRPTQTKTCVTAEKLQRAFLAPEQPGRNCMSKIINATSTMMDYSETCTGPMPSTSEVHVEAPSPTRLTITAKTTGTTARGRPLTGTVTVIGTWVAEACGNVK
jgi:hypothetical protein